MNNNEKSPNLIISLVPIVVLISLLIINVIIFKDDATGGPNQLALLSAGVVAIIIGIFFLKQDYHKIEKDIIKSMSISLQATIILLIIGSLIGVWILSGIVPGLIYYGLKIIHPSVFLPITCIVCCVVSLSTGSSWSTTGTIGIALIGMGHTIGIPEGMVAGAIISGAYFGDKMSPLSDTTNLAPAMAGTDLFTHIKHMTYTSGPAIIIAIIIFSILGSTYSTHAINTENINQVLNAINSNFNIGIHIFIAPIIVLILVAKKTPAIPALILGILAGILTAIIFQSDLLTAKSGGNLNLKGVYTEVTTVAFNGFSIDSGNKLIDKLLNRGGMSGMLNTIWLIFMAMIFGGALEGTKMLHTIASSILSLVRGAGSLVASTLTSCLVLNATASDQYLAIIVPGRMFNQAYKDHGLHPKNLSRALEDAGTVTSVLIPWNSGGAYNAGVLGVPTLEYLPFCFFNILSPIISAFLAGMGWTIDKVETDDTN